MKAMKTLAIAALFAGALSACVAPPQGGHGGRGGNQQATNTVLGAAVGGVAGYALGDSVGATLGGAALGGVIGSQVR